ncbi:MAG: stage V sporulation protein S [Chloroflexi bacterium]|nr:stage V sporulation protein S [Chloroflexota bacterium]
MEPIRVRADSPVNRTAGAIAKLLRENEAIWVQAIGAAAINQAVKSIATSRIYLEEDLLDCSCVPVFLDVEINGEIRTAIRFIVRRHDGYQKEKAS